MAKAAYPELKDLFSIPQTLKKIENRQAEIEKMLALLIEKSSSSESKPRKKRPGPSKKKGVPAKRKKVVVRAKRKAARSGKTTVIDLIATVLKGKKKPLSIAEIHDAIVGRKLYTGKSQDLKKLISVSLYRDPKNMFERKVPGKFKLAKK